MRALSVREPWASLIVAGTKPVENRTWQPPAERIGERFAVHAALTWDRAAAELLRFPIDDRPVGAIIGTVALMAFHADFHCSGGCDWGQQASYGERTLYHWVLRFPERLPEAVPAQGRLGFWEWTPPSQVENGQVAAHGR